MAATYLFKTCKVYEMELQNSRYPFSTTAITTSTSRNAISPLEWMEPHCARGPQPSCWSTPTNAWGEAGCWAWKWVKIHNYQKTRGIIELGRARHNDEWPASGRGDEEGAGGLGPKPVNFFWVKVEKKMAWDQDDCTFISVSLVHLIDVLLWTRPWKVCQHVWNTQSKNLTSWPCQSSWPVLREAHPKLYDHLCLL